MDWFEQVKDTVKKTAVAAYDKSGQLVDITKIKMSVLSAEGAVEKLYKELGEIYYKDAKDGKINDEEAITSICDAIGAKLEEIENLKSKIAAKKNMKICPSCGKEIPENAAFCPACGQKAMSGEATEEASEEDKPEE